MKSDYKKTKSIQLEYREKRNVRRNYYAFYHERLGKFVGTVLEFLNKFELKFNNVKGIISGTRKTARKWICFGKCELDFIFPTNVKQIYKERISVNNRLKDMTNNIYTFYKEEENHTLSVKEFCEKFLIDMVSIKRVCRCVRNSYMGWKIKK